jgi:Mrp family chromosome partitioning ATPase
MNREENNIDKSQVSLGTSTYPVPVANAPRTLEDDDGKVLRIIHAALRGRYLLAIALGAILAAALGSVGWFTTQPLYQATGYVRVKAYTPTILTDNEKSGEMPRYENYLKAQANTMRSRRVISDAMQSPQWQEHSKDLSPQARDRFTGSLFVLAQPEIEQILVQFKHENPEVASSATAVVIEAYAELQASIDRESDLARLAVLEELRTSYSSQLSQLRFQIEQVDRALGAQGIAAWHQAKVSQLAAYEQQVEQSKADLAVLNDLKQKRDEEGEPVDATILQDDAAEENRGNPLIPRIRDQLERLKDETLLLTERLGEQHRAVATNHDRILLLETELDRLIRNEDASLADQTTDDAKPVDVLQERIQVTTKQIDIATNQVAATRQELESLAEKLRQIDELRQQEQEFTASLAQTRARINELNIESELSDRVDVLSSGEVAWQPVNGGQRMARAGIGGAGGFLLGFGFVGLLGLLGKRVGRSDILQLDIGDQRLLGLMPDLTEKIKDGDSSRTAQASVDHIRSLIDLGRDDSTGTCLAITGPQSGSGKTTLAITLALSFAESGSKVLLIDLDVVGGGLSHHVKARRQTRLGEILADVAGVDRQRIEDVASRIRGGGKQLGQYLVEEGVVEQEHVDVAIERQSQEMGVRQALAGAEFEHCTFPSRTNGLYVLPLRCGNEKLIGRVGPRAIRQLFTRAKAAYDIVIVDTGPAPGSVETSLAAAAADATVVVVSRNEPRHEVRSCSEFLASVGATIYGFVMNRVENKDLQSSRISSSYSRVSQERTEHAGFNAADLYADHAASSSRDTTDAAASSSR